MTRVISVIIKFKVAEHAFDIPLAPVHLAHVFAIYLAIVECNVAAVAVFALWVAVLAHEVRLQSGFEAEGFVAIVASPTEVVVL